MHRLLLSAAMGIMLGLAIGMQYVEYVEAANTPYAQGGVEGAPNVGNWSWTNNAPVGGQNAKHIWWTKHYWTDQTTLDKVKNNSGFDMHLFKSEPPRSTWCDRFDVTKIILQKGTGAPEALRIETIRSECAGSPGGGEKKELVQIRVRDKTKLQVSPPTEQIGPAFAILADGFADFPEPCPDVAPGDPRCDDEQNGPQVNAGWSQSPFPHLGKALVRPCPGNTGQYRSIGSLPVNLIAATVCK